MDDLIRYIAIVETAAVMILAGSLAGRYLTRRGWIVLAFGALLGAREIVLVAAIYTNALSPIPPTPGVKVYAIAVAPIVLGLFVLTRFARSDDR